MRDETESSTTSAVSPAFGSQSYRERVASAGVDGLVSCVWVQEISAVEPVYEHRTVPSGAVEISSALGTGVVRVAGPQRGPVVELLAPGTTVVGVRFRPGVAHAILGLPASELVDLDVDIDRVWGRSSEALGQRLAEAASPDDAATLLEREIVARSIAGPGHDALVVAAVSRLQPWRGASVGDVTAELFISARQLHRRFIAALGYGPKTLQRILRFQAFLALSHAHADDGSLTRLAAAAGYADQAHLGRECSRLAGLTPSAFLEAMHRSCDASHDHAASSALSQALLGKHVRNS
jgi:AraC-like DNA-binding protein